MKKTSLPLGCVFACQGVVLFTSAVLSVCVHVLVILKYFFSYAYVYCQTVFIKFFIPCQGLFFFVPSKCGVVYTGFSAEHKNPHFHCVFDENTPLGAPRGCCPRTPAGACAPRTLWTQVPVFCYFQHNFLWLKVAPINNKFTLAFYNTFCDDFVCKIAHQISRVSLHRNWEAWEQHFSQCISQKCDLVITKNKSKTI